MAVKYQENYGVFIHELYETYSRLIYKEAWKYFDSIYDVEDLVQEVWIKLCQKVGQLYGFSKAQTVSYIITSVKNNAISMMRKQHPECPLEYADNIAYHIMKSNFLIISWIGKCGLRYSGKYGRVSLLVPVNCWKENIF